MSYSSPVFINQKEAGSAEKPSSTWSRTLWAANLVSAGYLAFAIVVVLADLTDILRHFTRYPFGDHWIWLAKLYESGPLTALHAQYNEHRLTVPGLFYLLDHRWFGATNTFLIGVSMAIQLGCILLLVLPLWRHRQTPRRMRFVFTGFVAIAMLWFIQSENFFYAFSMCLACANLGILAAIHLFVRLHDPESQPPRSTLLWTGVIASGAWATFSYGHGLLVWPALLPLAFALRVPRRSWIVLASAFLVVAVLYFYDYKTPPGHANPLASLEHPLRVIQYVIVMLGLPLFGAGAQDLSIAGRFGNFAVTTAGILTGIAMLVHFALSKPSERFQGQAIYCGVLLLALGSAFVTALGRSAFPITQALSGRYAPIPLLFWISAIALATMYIARWEANGGVGRTIWCALLIAASTMTLSTQLPMGRYFAIRERGQSAVALSLTVGVPDTSRIEEEMNSLPLVSLVDSGVKRTTGHSLFARPEAALLGSPLLEHFQLAPAGACNGIVDSAARLRSESPIAGARLFGWAWDPRNQRELSHIWVTDDRMIVRGLGITGAARPDVATAFRNPAMDTSGWIAYTQLPASRELNVFAGIGDGRTVCRIGAPAKAAE